MSQSEHHFFVGLLCVLCSQASDVTCSYLTLHNLRNCLNIQCMGSTGLSIIFANIVVQKAYFLQLTV